LTLRERGRQRNLAVIAAPDVKAMLAILEEAGSIAVEAEKNNDCSLNGRPEH
jgi:hypothetical protein